MYKMTQISSCGLLVFLFLNFSFSNAQEWSSYNPDNSPVKNISAVKDIAVDPITQDVWLAADQTVYVKKNDGTWMTFEIGTAPGLTLTAVSCVSAHNGIAWVGQYVTNALTDKLCYYDGTWHTVILPVSYYFIADIEISEEYVWVATSSGLFQYNGSAWKKLDYQEKIKAPTAISWNKPTRKLWVSNNCVGTGNAFRYDVDADTWKEFALPQNCVHAIQVLPDGNAYAGSCNASSVSAIINDQPSSQFQTACFAVDGMSLDPLNARQVWAGTEYNYGQAVPFGLLLYDGNSIVKSFNFRNSAMKGGSIESIAVQKINETTATVWLKTFQSFDTNYPTGSFLETYTYHISASPLNSFQFTNPQIIATINGSEVKGWAPLNTDLSSLKAVFTVPDAAVVKVGDVVQVSGVTSNDFRTPVIYTVMNSAGIATNFTVNISIASNSILSFRFREPGVDASIQGNEITAALPSTVDRSQLVTDFTFSPGAVVKVNGITQQSGVSANDFRTPVVYSVSSALGEIKNYNAIVSVVTEVDDKERHELHIFPNPAKDHFSVKVNSSMQLLLFSVLGEELDSRTAEAGQEVFFEAPKTANGIVILKAGDRYYKVLLIR
ncbi:hypothetical protein WSM22_19740 [Cytophagales bacterium WSM2-2]|nr:hypothetical protein WSM22_19740 [Cytophagales bacterium WSM2-2]